MGKNPDFDTFYRGLEALKITLAKEQEEQFLLYYNLLTEWNARMNLTAITEWDEVVRKHFLDSLCLVKAVPELTTQRLIDVGTGAGFPGIPLKIAFPGMDVVLLDSVSKKLAFVDAVIEKLHLHGARTVHGRAEDLAREQAHRQQFDLCVSRAVADLSVLSEYCLPFVRIGGDFVAYKSAGAEEEVERADRAVRLLGGERMDTVSYLLPETQDGRSLVRVRKRAETPRAYPRKAGKVAKNPL